MSRSKKIKITAVLVVLIALIAALAVWYFSPKVFLDGVEPSEISSVTVFDGNTGKEFEIGGGDDIRYITENIQGAEMKKDGFSLGNSGYGFRMTFYDADGKEIESFILNGGGEIRKDPFFYKCGGGLCYNYVKMLEDKYAK